MTALAQKECEPCRADSPPLSEAEIEASRGQIPDWRVVERDGAKRLERVFRFPDFAEALAFTTRIGELAERENHHPSILTEWGRVTVTWWTHKIKGLHSNDLVMAAKTDELYGSR